MMLTVRHANITTEQLITRPKVIFSSRSEFGVGIPPEQRARTALKNGLPLMAITCSQNIALFACVRGRSEINLLGGARPNRSHARLTAQFLTGEQKGRFRVLSWRLFGSGARN